MSLKKIVSDVSDSRDVREGEEGGWDYYFRPIEEMHKDKADDNYFQYIELWRK